MSYHEEDKALTKKYIKQAKAMKATGILFIVIQVVLALAVFAWTNSFVGLLVGFALFTVGKWFIEENLAREYLVTKYVGKTIIDEYTTHGGVMGGIIRMAGMVLALVLIKVLLNEFIFPVDSFIVDYMYGIGLLWVVLHSILRDISKIKTGEQILKATQNPDQRDILFRVQDIQNAEEKNNEKNNTRLTVAMIGIVVLLLLAQTVISWVQGATISKELDMYNEYQKFYVEHDGQYRHETIPELSEEWFEQVSQQDETVKFTRFKTKCSVEGTAVDVQNGISYEITMEILYIYSDLNGWQLSEAYCVNSSFAEGDDSTPVFENITGTWHGVGRDKTVNTSDNNELTIVLDKMTTTEVSGSITCERYGEILYTKTFSGTVELYDEYLDIVATYDQEDIFYPTIRFAYDLMQDIIYNIDISPDTKLARVNE